LGTGDHWFELELAKLAKRLPRILSVTTGYDEGLAHRIEAGADVFVMASRYEPCGLNQLYSLRYGTLPIVRRTGGLADTVVDVDEAAKTGELGTGFVFSDVTTDSLRATLARATTHFANKAEWAQFQIHAMRQDFSWEKSATTYEAAYQSAIDARKRIKSRYPATPPQSTNKTAHDKAISDKTPHQKSNKKISRSAP
jgi:starch synthase